MKVDVADGGIVSDAEDTGTFLICLTRGKLLDHPDRFGTLVGLRIGNLGRLNDHRIGSQKLLSDSEAGALDGLEASPRHVNVLLRRRYSASPAAASPSARFQ